MRSEMNTVVADSEARAHFVEMMEQVCDDQISIVIARERQRSVVLMSLEEYQALEETAYLLRSPENARRLIDSIAQLESGGGVERRLIERSSYSRKTLGKTICIGSEQI